jgi:hypothetical protein
MTDPTARAQLLQHLHAPLAPQLIYLAVKLGIPDLLHDGARSSADLAHLTHVHAPTLHRVLRGMGNPGSWAALVVHPAHTSARPVPRHCRTTVLPQEYIRPALALNLERPAA